MPAVSQAADNLVYSMTYEYDLAGNRRSATETIAGIGTRPIAWGYMICIG